mmetsp:Transcript_12731/g.18581  ORF Transcript_12731/g.18581 Transcript_12731/m.18581 type:complete len:192 (-) Transcript_12731:1032-1607(-)
MVEKEPGDYKTEVHFIGQVVYGTHFETTAGLFCEIHLEYGETWRELPDKQEQSIQTQTAYPSPEGLHVFAHPLDLHFATDSIYGWPQLVFRVWRLDEVGRIDLMSYGVCALPCTSGVFSLEVPTWRPLGKWYEETMAFFVGGPPRLLNQDILTADVSKRSQIKTISSGTLHLDLEVLLRNFGVHWTNSYKD